MSDITFRMNREASEMKARAIERGAPFLDYVTDETLRSFALAMWTEAPDYFFVIPASSSGKHHWATGIGGLFDHVLMAMYCSKELAVTFGLSAHERNLALVAAAGHDCLKYGIEYDTRYFDMHPFLPRSYYVGLRKMIDYSDWETVMCAIERHMGDIAGGNWTSVGRVKPETSVEQVVHLADFMASRKEIKMIGMGAE